MSTLGENIGQPTHCAQLDAAVTNFQLLKLVFCFWDSPTLVWGQFLKCNTRPLTLYAALNIRSLHPFTHIVFPSKYLPRICSDHPATVTKQLPMWVCNLLPSRLSFKAQMPSNKMEHKKSTNFCHSFYCRCEWCGFILLSFSSTKPLSEDASEKLLYCDFRETVETKRTTPRERPTVDSSLRPLERCAT